MKVTKLLDATQARWRLLPSLTIVAAVGEPPLWAIDAARHVALNVQPGDMAFFRAQLRRRADQLATLHRRWVVAAVLAVLLAMAVVSTAAGFPLDNIRMGILSAVLSAILLPPIAICNGIARDYVAARALSIVLGSAVVETSPQSVG
jgi:hypothetical protein